MVHNCYRCSIQALNRRVTIPSRSTSWPIRSCLNSWLCLWFLTWLHLLLAVLKPIVELGKELLHRHVLPLFCRVGSIIIVHRPWIDCIIDCSISISFILLAGGEKVLLRRWWCIHTKSRQLSAWNFITFLILHSFVIEVCVGARCNWIAISYDCLYMIYDLPRASSCA